MSTGISHEEYVLSVRARIVALAIAMIDESVPFLDGAIEIAEMLHGAEIDTEDQDYVAFKLISCETDHLPIGRVKKYWSDEAIKKHEEEVNLTTDWAREFGVPACHSLIEKFSSD